MADYAYSNLPAELHTEFLLQQSPDDIINHCRVNIDAQKAFQSKYFWTKYIKNMSKHKVIILIKNIAKNAQDMLYAILEAYKHVFGNINKDFLLMIRFFAIMHGSKKVLELLDTELGPTKLPNPSSVIKTTTKLIDFINGGKYSTEKETETVFANWHNALLLSEQKYDKFDIYDAVIERLNPDAINKLPVYLPKRRGRGYIIKSPKYDTFIAWPIWRSVFSDGSGKNASKSFDEICTQNP